MVTKKNVLLLTKVNKKRGKFVILLLSLSSFLTSSPSLLYQKNLVIIIIIIESPLWSTSSSIKPRISSNSSLLLSLSITCMLKVAFTFFFSTMQDDGSGDSNFEI